MITLELIALYFKQMLLDYSNDDLRSPFTPKVLCIFQIREASTVTLKGQSTMETG